MQYSQELVEDLALVYLVLTGYADGKLTEAEKEGMEDVLNVWTDGFLSEEMKDLIPYTQRRFAEARKHGQAHRRLADAIDGIFHRLHRSKLKIVLHDLLALAKIDGEVNQNERKFIEMVAARWGFKLEEKAYQKAA
ncbi:MAG: tellurite resistance TerB family protein [Chloroherpetonaceae bacterium]|nr:tellurite resistance TerB family protein [Chloroherpetonaceae bacterium]